MPQNARPEIDHRTDNCSAYTSATSPSIRRLISQAKGLMGNLSPFQDLEVDLGQLISESPDMDESDRQQLEELARILPSVPGNHDSLEILRRDGRFTLFPSADKMLLMISIEPPVAGGKPVTVHDVLSHLRSQGIHQGVDLPVLHQAITTAQNKPVSQLVLVRGRPPVAGKPAHFELFVRQTSGEEPQKIPLGSIKKSDKSLWFCKRGDRLLRLVPAQPATSGYNAIGQELPAPILPEPEIETDANIQRDGDDYIATASGQVLFDGRRIEVRPVLFLNEDITGQGGPVVFEGEVYVHAAVRRGAKIIATGDITISGPVEAAHVESTGGDIRLKHGVVGQNQGLIKAAGNVITRFAENAAVTAGRDILMDVGSLHSHLVAGRAILINRGRGQIVGGSVMAGEHIEVKQLGARSDVITDVWVGLSKEVMDQLALVNQRIFEFQQQEKTTRELADRIKRAIGDPIKLNVEEREAYAQLRKTQLICVVQIHKLQKEQQGILEASVKNKAGHVDILHEMMPKVIVRIGGAVLRNNIIQERCRLEFDPTSGQVLPRRLL